MFSIFRKKIIPDFSNLGTDLHSHLLPGIDDGAKTLEDSIKLINQLVEIGYSKIITTPHIMGEYYLNTPEIIRNSLAILRKELIKENVKIEIEAAAEYFVDDDFIQKLNVKEEILTFSNDKVLIEFSMLGEAINPLEVIFKLKAQGYNPIIAHPERYIYYSDNMDIFSKIIESGGQLQVNLLSLTGHYGVEQKKIAYKLLDNGLVKYLGTDCHNENHMIKIKAMFTNRKIRNLITKGEFGNNQL